MEFKKIKKENHQYLESIRTKQSVFYEINESEIRYYEDGKFELAIKWSGLSGIIEDENYFYLKFAVKSNSIWIPKFTVTSEFYNEFLEYAKSILDEKNAYKI